jgi:pSer/pThr/pTyr-binding forkhead associated (FHA) protein
MSSAICKNEVVAKLERRSGGRSYSCELRQGDRFYIGSDKSSDVCLKDAGVAPTHCSVSVGTNSVTVEDCYSEEGTYVDGTRIRSQEISSDAAITVGAAKIALRMRGTSNKPEPGAATLPDMDQPLTDSPPLDTPAPSATEIAHAEAPLNSDDDTSCIDGHDDPSNQESEDVDLELLQAREEIRILQQRLDSSAAGGPTPAGDPFQDEMIQLMRAEVLELQAALAERDQLDGAPVRSTGEPNSEEFLPRDDAEKLVDRLEQLLAELAQKDDQVATLTEMLQLAEEANRTEREEREQMDKWLKDIEERFGHREQEWQCERNELQKTIESVADERNRAETAINADSSSAKLEAANNVLHGLRETAESQRERLLELEQTNAQLTRKAAETPADDSREDRMQLAKERAELARHKQEFEASRQHTQSGGVDETTLKLQVLRQHLNTIHAEEQAEKEERKLSNRIARLWRRLDGG